MAVAPSYQQYLQEATGVYTPQYKVLEDERKGYYTTLRDMLMKRLKGEFNTRGILDSGLYGEELASTERETARSESKELAEIGLARTRAIEGLAGTRYGQAYDTYSTELENERELEKIRRADERARIAAVPAAALATPRATGGGGRSRAASTPSPSNAAAEIFRQGVGEWDTERRVIPFLQQKYGLSWNEAATYAYRARKLVLGN